VPAATVRHPVAGLCSIALAPRRRICDDTGYPGAPHQWNVSRSDQEGGVDRERFDALTRLAAAPATRRGAVAALAASLGAAIVGRELPPVMAKRKRRGRRRVGAETTRPCYPGARCAPGKGRNTSGCDFSKSIDLFQRDLRGTNLSNTNFTDAQLAEADLRGANLSGSCLVGANLIGARLGASVNLHNAVFCRTLMPDGSYDDRDCGEGTACCPAPFRCEGPLCPATCIGAPNAQCSPNVPYGGCCPGLHCVPSSTAPTRFTCQAPCGADGSCRARFGTPWICASEPVICRYLGGECCQHI
jgi:hypothetical protein